jgi:hypothetical protein
MSDLTDAINQWDDYVEREQGHGEVTSMVSAAARAYAAGRTIQWCETHSLVADDTHCPNGSWVVHPVEEGLDRWDCEDSLVVMRLSPETK